MKIVLDYDNGYNLTIVDNNIKRNITDYDFINSYIINIRGKIKSFKEIDGSLYAYIDNNLIILKDYEKNCHLRLYNYISQKITKNKKVSNINIKLIASLSSIVLITSALGALLKEKTDNSNDIYETQNYETVITTEATLSPLNWEDVKYDYFENMFDNIVYKELEEDNFDFDTRINQTKEIQNGNNNLNFPISSNVNQYVINRVDSFINTNAGKYCFEYCEQFGVDPYLFISLLIQESSLNHQNTIPGGKNYNGYGVGICQLESPSGQKITAYNHSSLNEEVAIMSMTNASNLEKNIKMGVMIFQNRTNRYNGNIYLTLQSYNYGVGAMDLIVDMYAKQQGLSREFVLNNYEDNGWMTLVQSLHDNPKSFANSIDENEFNKYLNIINYLKKWNGTYGDGNYTNNVISNYIGKYSRYYVDDLKVDLDLTTGILTKTVTKSNVKS